MAGVEDEFRDAATAPPPSPSSASPPSTPKPAVAAGGFGRRLLASIRLPTTFSTAIGRSSTPSNPETSPAPAVASKLGLGLLLQLGPKPSADSSPVPDASARNLHLPPTGALQQQHGDEVVLEEQGAAARRAQLAPQHGEDQVVGHDVGVGEELVVPVPVEEEGRLTAEGREKEGVADGCSAKRNDFSLQDQEKEGEQRTSDELGAAMEDPEVVEQEGATKYYTAEQCTGDAPRAIKNDSVVGEKEKAMEQGCAVGILGATEDGVAVGLQEEDVVVQGQGVDAISVQDQHKVVEQCTSDEVGVAMGDSAVQDQEVVVVEQEGVTEYFDAAVGYESNYAAVQQCTSDELRADKDGNIVEEKEKAVEQEGAIVILGAAEDDVAVGSQEEEEVMVVAEQAEDGISYQDKVVEQCTSDQVRTTADVNVAQDQEVVEQEGAIVERVATADGIAAEAQEKAVEQSAGDESRATKDENAVVDKEKVVDQEGVIDKQDAIKHGSAVKSQEEQDMVVAEQGWDAISVQDQDKVVEQCTSDQLRTGTVDNAAEDQEVSREKVWLCVGYPQITGSAIKNGSAVKSQEDMVVVEQGWDAISVQDQVKVVEQCTSDQLKTTTVDSAAEDQEVGREKVRFCVGYPQRPGKPNCRVYMSTGSCTYGLSCRLNHPQLKAKAEVSSFPSEQGNREVAQFLELNRVGLPIREGARNCTYYMRNGTCRYGKKCCFNHPEHVLDVQIYRPTGWDDTNLPSSPQSKKSSEHATLDDISSSSEFLPPNILRMLLPPQNVPPGTEEKEMKVKKDPDWSSSSDDSDGCCSADSAGGPLCKQEHHVDYPERPGRKECPFLLRFGNCKFASACQYYHPKDKFPSRYHPKNPSLAEELMVYPDNPGEPACPFYMKTGSCKFGAECKFHHPKDLPPSTQDPAVPKRVFAANEHHSAAITTPQDHMYQQQNYPERPGQPDCRYYMQFGKCKFLSACIFHHPKDRLPSGMPDCPFLMKTGRCQFGSTCEFRHPKGGVIDDGTDCGHDSFTKSENVLQQQEHAIYPERPGGLECTHYMKHGYCKFQMNCKFHHPADRLSQK